MLDRQFRNSRAIAKRVDVAIKSRLLEQVELLECPVRESREKCESQGDLYLSRGILHYDDRTHTQVTILASYTGCNCSVHYRTGIELLPYSR